MPICSGWCSNRALCASENVIKYKSYTKVTSNVKANRSVACFIFQMTGVVGVGAFSLSRFKVKVAFIVVIKYRRCGSETELEYQERASRDQLSWMRRQMKT